VGGEISLVKKHFTILVVPQNGSRVRRIHVPEGLMFLAAGIAASLMVLLAFGVYTSHQHRTQLARVTTEQVRLEASNDAKEDQIRLFASKIQGLEERLHEMQVIERKLRVMANLREERRTTTPSPRFSVGGVNLEEEHWAFGMYNLEAALRDEMIVDLERLELEASLQEQSLKELNHSFLEKSIREAHMPSIWPASGLMTSSYGQRVNPITGIRQFHTGLDIAARRGTAVHATASGVIVFAGRSSGLGKTVVISHGNGLKTRYAHLSAAYVAPGHRVSRGTKIGAIGSSGRATGPHLHYEVLKSGVAVNPRKYIDN
jgi:murein DD-endopeptidase MepM/ murein hydrolase activator NlpD